VKDTDAKVLCLSALLTTTMTAQKDVIEALKTAGVRGKVKVMVGGAPVTQSFADEIGADAYTPDAATAAEVCRTFYA
jgi:5-methyltetrahydrofolate--homocysteine methyltransferase